MERSIVVRTIPATSPMGMKAHIAVEVYHSSFGGEFVLAVRGYEEMAPNVFGYTLGNGCEVHRLTGKTRFSQKALATTAANLDPALVGRMVETVRVNTGFILKEAP